MKMYFSARLHNHKMFAWNSVLVAHNYRIRRKLRRRIISIK